MENYNNTAVAYGTIYWFDFRREIIKQACLVSTNWPEVVKYCRDRGIKASGLSIRQIAYNNKFERPLMEHGGDRRSHKFLKK